MKKLFSLIVLSLVFFALFSYNYSVYAIESNEQYISNLEVLTRQNESFLEYSKIMLTSKNYYNFDNEFGGVFINDNGELCVNIVSGKEINFIKNMKLSERDNIYFVKYSLKQIENELENMSEYLGQYGIIGVGRSEIDNSIVVITSMFDDENIATIISLCKLDNIIVKNSYGSMPEPTVHYVTNGVEATISNSYGSESFTVGFAAQDANGKPGYVIPGHVNVLTGVGINTGVYYGGSYSGKITQISFADGVSADAAFVKCYDPLIGQKWLPTKTFMNGDTYSIASTSTLFMVQGTYVYAYGKVSGKQAGRILLADSDSLVRIDNNTVYTIHHSCYASYRTAEGDSGAAVAYWFHLTGVVGNYYNVMGIQSSTLFIDDDENPLTPSVWVDGQSYSVFTTVNNIFNTLNISDYTG